MATEQERRVLRTASSTLRGSQQERADSRSAPVALNSTLPRVRSGLTSASSDRPGPQRRSASMMHPRRVLFPAAPQHRASVAPAGTGRSDARGTAAFEAHEQACHAIECPLTPDRGQSSPTRQTLPDAALARAQSRRFLRRCGPNGRQRAGLGRDSDRSHRRHRLAGLTCEASANSDSPARPEVVDGPRSQGSRSGRS